MTGVIDEKSVRQARIEHEEVPLRHIFSSLKLTLSSQYKESMILRHILKHLRQRRLLGPYQSILSRTGFGRGSTSQNFEHPVISSLHNALVLEGQFSDAETLLESGGSRGLFSSSILSFQPTAAWSRIDALGDPEGVTTQPSARGGHAMCLDRESGLIYMFGGWDGKKNLQDFWVWSIHEMKWKLLKSNGPAPRACHKMVFNEQTGDIFLFGTLDDNVSSESTPSPTSSTRTGHRAASSEPPPRDRRGNSAGPSTAPEDASRMSPGKINTICAELYRYRTRGPRSGEWELVSPDTQVYAPRSSFTCY